MKVTVVGHWGGYPAPNGATSSYIVEKDGFTLVLDMGSGALSKLQNYKKVTEIDAVLLSHYHHDHVADIGVLQYARLVQFYVTGMDQVLPIYGHTEDQLHFDRLTHDFTKGIGYNPNKPLSIGPFTIYFLKTDHPVPCYGMRITDGESVLIYTADTSYNEKWIDFSLHADVMIADCNFYADQDGQDAGHMNSVEVGMIAEQAAVKTLILSHLPQYGDHNQLIKEAKQHFSGEVLLAYEGLIWKK